VHENPTFYRYTREVAAQATEEAVIELNPNFKRLEKRTNQENKMKPNKNTA
jgi:hypothetical protein